MANIEAGGDIIAGGNITVKEVNVTEYRPLYELNSDDLRYDRVLRFKVLKKENDRKQYLAFRILLVGIFVSLALSIWYLIAGTVELPMLILAGLGVFIPIVISFSTLISPTAFEQRQYKALGEISDLLKERDEE